jgi:4'-phosphopantetheinyl transferase
MQLIAVSNSFISNNSIIEKYFSKNELRELSQNTPINQLNERVLGRIALKLALTDQDHDQFIIDYINSGEPILINKPNLFCSIAHSYDIGIAGAATFRIGVDVEKIRKHDESLLKHIASTEDLSLFNEENQDVLVTKIWVIKEAVSKALGVGIAYPFINMKIEKEGNDYAITAGYIKWSIKVMQYNDYIIGYCYPCSELMNNKINIKYIQ